MQSHNISYIKEYSFADLIGQNGGRLRFDFAILKDNKLMGLIEFNGIQHYQPIEFFGGNEKFIQQQNHDKQKVDFCADNNIPFLVISYDKNKEEIESEVQTWFKSIM